MKLVRSLALGSLTAAALIGGTAGSASADTAHSAVPVSSRHPGATDSLINIGDLNVINVFLGNYKNEG